MVYVGSALGLLLTTSFLGLRRYLRQRSMEMPGDMAGLWLGIGTFIVLALLVFCVLLPRPGASVAVSQLPFTFGSPEHQRTHDKARGNDGPERPDAATRTRDDAQQAGPNAPASDQGKSTSAQQQPGSRSAQDRQSRTSSDNSSGQQSDNDPGQSGDQDSSSSKSNSRQKSTSQSGSQGSDQSAEAGSGSPQDARSKQQPGQGKAGDQNDSSNRGKSDQTDNRTDHRQGSTPRKGAQSESESQTSSDRAPRNDASRPPPSSSTRRPESQKPQPQRNRSEPSTAPNQPSQPGAVSRLLGNLSQGLGALLKLVFWAALLGVLGYFFWKHHQQVLAAIRQLLNDLRDLLAWLLGGRRQREQSAEETAAKRQSTTAKPFSSYQDPFASGAARSHSTEQLVRYTFEALEAWAREQRCPRSDEQTPLEFARQLAVVHPQLGVNAQQLADLYSRVAYGHQSITRDRCTVLQELWRHMLSTASLPLPA